MKRLFIASSLLCVFSLGAADPAPQLPRLRPDSEGFIRDWLMFAPVELVVEGGGSDPILRQHLPNEATLQPRIRERATVDGHEVMWRAVRAREFFFDFNELIGELTQNSVGYMVAYVVCDREMPGLTLLAGGNDQWRIYLNGREAMKHLEAGPLAKDAEKTEKLTLKQGVNTIVFKVANELNNWQGCLRFTDNDGKAVTNFTLKLAP
jgi:hypothetical protein